MSLASALGLVATVLAFTGLLFAAINWGIRRRLASEASCATAAGAVPPRVTAATGDVVCMPAELSASAPPASCSRAQLVMFGVSALEPVPLAELHRYRIEIDGDRLLIGSDDPVGATGSIEVRFRLPDLEDWLNRLTALQNKKTHMGPNAQ